MLEIIKVSGKIEIFLNGDLTETHNLVVDAGKAWIADRMTNANTVMTHIAVGSDGTVESAPQTTLVAETARKAMTTSGGVPTGATVVYEVSFNAGEGTGTINEAGIFNDGTTGTMLSRAVIGPYNKAANDIIAFIWTISIN
jgi:hypothetical protein